MAPKKKVKFGGWVDEGDGSWSRGLPRVGWAVSILLDKDTQTYTIIEEVGSEEIIQEGLSTISEAKLWVMEEAYRLAFDKKHMNLVARRRKAGYQESQWDGIDRR